MTLLSVEVDGQLHAGLEYVVHAASLADDALGVGGVEVETTIFGILEQLTRMVAPTHSARRVKPGGAGVKAA